MANEVKSGKRREVIRVGLSILLCLCALAGGGWAFLALADLKEAPQQRHIEEAVYKVDVFETERLNLRELIFGFGTARPYREVVLSAEVGGLVVEKHPKLKVGFEISAEKVSIDEKGRTQPTVLSLPLLRINPETYQQRVEQATGRIAEFDAELEVLAEQHANNERLLKQARENVEVYQREYDRVEDLHNKKIASKTQLTMARLELERYKQAALNLENERRLFPVRKLQLERRRATAATDLETAQLDLERTEIRPPFSGVLGEVSVELGQNLRPGDPLVRLLDLAIIEIPVALPLAEYEKIAAILATGRPPVVSLARNATSPGQWTGYIERVSPRADESTRTIEVFIRVENNEQAVPLLPGTFVHARIQGPLIEDALAIPRDCVVDGTVFLVDGERSFQRKVLVNRTVQSLALITGGVEASDRIIMTNLDILDDSAKVEVQTTRNLADELELMQLPLVVPELVEKPAPARKKEGG